MYRLTLGIIFLVSFAVGQNHITVIYPEAGQQIASVDSTFIFGNTNRLAKLTINGQETPVHEDGGFLAFLPVEDGQFEFMLISVLEKDSLSSVHNIFVGDSIADTSDSFILRSSVSPSGRTVLAGSEIFEFSLSAQTQGRAYCSFKSDSDWTPMYLNDIDSAPYSVFGDISRDESRNKFSEFTGYLSTADFEDSSRVYFLCELDIKDSSGMILYTEFEIDSTEYYVAKIPAVPPRVVMLTGRPHIIRAGPGQGYKLVNQPDGIRFLYAGETPNYFRLKLASDATGYVRKIDAVLLPVGVPPPKGEVSFIRIDNYSEYLELSMVIGEKLPYEIHDDGNQLTIDFFYLVSDTDWIRFNGGSQKYAESIWWSQPQDDIYRLHIKWYDSHFWGYEPYYEGDTFKLRLVKRLDKGVFLSSPVKGLRIVIDPGHSHDSGAMGPTGLPEKDANLWIAHELRRILLKKGAEVLMTRMGHENIGLYDRVDIADKWNADLLISIHNNALPDGINPFTHNGTSVYYYFNQARPLAEAIHKHLVNATGLPDHGLYYGNLALCRFSECPSVLVECAFMMIPEQEAMLKTDKFQRKCAKAIYKGICDYLQNE